MVNHYPVRLLLGFFFLILIIVFSRLLLSTIFAFRVIDFTMTSWFGSKLELISVILVVFLYLKGRIFLDIFLWFTACEGGWLLTLAEGDTSFFVETLEVIIISSLLAVVSVVSVVSSVAVTVLASLLVLPIASFVSVTVLSSLIVPSVVVITWTLVISAIFPLEIAVASVFAFLSHIGSFLKGLLLCLFHAGLLCPVLLSCDVSILLELFLGLDQKDFASVHFVIEVRFPSYVSV